MEGVLFFGIVLASSKRLLTMQICRTMPFLRKVYLRKHKNKDRELLSPQTADIAKVRMLREQGLSLATIAKECGISKTRVHQILAA